MKVPALHSPEYERLMAKILEIDGDLLELENKLNSREPEVEIPVQWYQLMPSWVSVDAEKKLIAHVARWLKRTPATYAEKKAREEWEIECWIRAIFGESK